MATEETTETEESGKSGKNKLLLIGLLSLMPVIAAASYFIGYNRAIASQTKEEPKKVQLAALYYKFEPAFVVNFGGEGNARFLQVMLQGMSRSPEAIELMKANDPAIRNDLLLLFSKQQPEALMAPEGRETLRQVALETVRKVMEREGGKPDGVESIYFTSFVIQ